MSNVINFVFIYGEIQVKYNVLMLEILYCFSSFDVLRANKVFKKKEIKGTIVNFMSFYDLYLNAQWLIWVLI